MEPTIPHETRRATASPGFFPSINATANRGPPPSYEEANDPNGIYISSIPILNNKIPK